MKILKRIALVLVALIALVLIIALFINGEYRITANVEINKPKQEVYNYVKMLRNQSQYGYWNLKDPNTKTVYSGEDGTVGFNYTWDSEEMGKGSQEIAGLTEGERVDYKLHFIEPFEGDATSGITTTAVSDQVTKAEWTMASKMPYPMNIMRPMMEKELQSQLLEGLNNLKRIMESAPAPAAEAASADPATAVSAQ